MSKFWMVTEDPFYDDDGQLVDEDAQWQDIKQEVKALSEDSHEPPEACYIMDYDPYSTVNS